MSLRSSLLARFHCAAATPTKSERTDMNHQKAIRPVKPRITKPLTFEQVKALLSTAKGEMKTLILLAATTGQRLDDLLALRWQDVDLANRVISFHLAKTRRAMVMPMTEDAKAHLERLPTGGPDSLVLPGLGNRPAAVVSRQFGKLAKQVGHAGARFHALRVTFVYQLQTVSATPGDLMAVLDHAKKPSKPSEFSLAKVIAKLPPLK